MTPDRRESCGLTTPKRSRTAPLHAHVDRVIDDLLFVARLAGINGVLMMAFFEGFITRFMPYLADLARRQGSSEREYTEVHGVVDIEHTEGLFRALEAEMRRTPTHLAGAATLLDGVGALRAL